MQIEEMKEVMEAVQEVNEAIYEKINPNWESNNGSQDDYNFPSLTIKTNVDYTIISFMDIIIWSNEEDEREFIEEKNEYEPLKPFLIKEMKCLIEKSVKILDI